ncbi:carboxypeptidase [Anaeramoeba ignava]|uniref:Carboxypeptidase n=1 Tax=Anaeramoeba ignava TaxID=1746090 RepID=A0A9Q0LFA2_ANAIG|nr:carboxypeptidase [Anaeramoeba ignava]
MNLNLITYIITAIFLLQTIKTHPKVVINNITKEETRNETETEIAGYTCYSGYILANETSGAYLFFVYIERNTSNPLQLVLAGGPGCSSSDDLFLALGPSLIQPDGSFINNSNAWTDIFNLLFIDNPVGSGYSYIDDPDGYPTNQSLVSQQLYTSLLVFFDKYNISQDKDFYIYGASYCGKYIPALGYKILQEGFVINLKGVIIGDGITDPVSQMNYSYYAYATGLIGELQYPIIHAKELECVNLMQNESWLDAANCMIDIWGEIVNMSGGVNVYDIRLYGDYNFTALDNFMQSNSTKETFGVDLNTTWWDCDGPPTHYLYEDMPKSVKSDFEALLANGTKIFLYTGQFDLIITLVGSLNFLSNVNWEYMDDFNNSTRIIWKVDDEMAGFVKHYKNLWFGTIVDQAKHTHNLAYRFVNDLPFD